MNSAVQIDDNSDAWAHQCELEQRQDEEEALYQLFIGCGTVKELSLIAGAAGLETKDIINMVNNRKGKTHEHQRHISQ